MMCFFWCMFFCFIFFFSLYFSNLIYQHTVLKKSIFFYIIVFIFLIIFCFVIYLCVGNSKLLPLYYNKKMVETRLKQEDLRLVLIKYNKQLFKLKYYVIRNPYLSKNWFSLGKLYEIQQNYFLAMNSFYKAHKLDSNNINYLVSYLINRVIITKGNINEKEKLFIKEALILDYSNIFLLSILNVNNLVKICN